MKTSLKLSILTSSFVVFASLILFSGSVLAQTTAVKNKPLQVQNRLTDEKLKVCRAKESLLLKKIQQLNKLAYNILDNFNSIAERVEEYYTTKVLPSGKTVSNYSGLIADVAAKKASVQTIMSSAQSDTADFKCTGDPKAQLTKYRTDMQSVKRALKDYRTSIKNLIVAVHSVIGETQRNQASPKPTKT